VFDWLLPKFGKGGLDKEESFYEFVAARMRNYMTEIIWKHVYRPEHYDSFDVKLVTADHVARRLQ
jgi:hypothetical protein